MQKLAKRWIKRKPFILFIILLLLICFLRYAAFDLLDDLFPLNIKPITFSQRVFASDNTLIWKYQDRQGFWRYPVTIDHVAKDYLDALITFEDKKFYQHHGINYLSLLRAGWQGIIHGKIISGGSTLTMQTARLVSPSKHTLVGKIIQLFRALQLEKNYSKQQILTFYLNRAPFGGNIEGIGAASRIYFNKSPSELNLNESALLAVLPQSPSFFRPDRYPERAKIARNKVIARLRENHHWNNYPLTLLEKEPIQLQKERIHYLAPIFSRRIAKKSTAATLHTTLDRYLQQHVESMVKHWKPLLPSGVSLGIIIVDHTNMKIKTYIGSVDFHDDKRYGQVDMVTALRSPGSTLKPFLYALALDHGLIDSASLLQDIPRIGSDYRPHNFMADFSGPVTADEALTRSLNLPAVQLLSIYGPKQFVKQLKNAHIKLHFPKNATPTLPLILGGTSVTLENLVEGYSAFARKGETAQLRYSETSPLNELPLISEGSAWITKQILSRQHPNFLNDSHKTMASLAWKTGTSFGYRDAWAVGITPRYLIGILVARPDGMPVVGLYGNRIAIPMLSQIRQLLEHYTTIKNISQPQEKQPKTVSIAKICWPKGEKYQPYDENCLQPKMAWVLNGLTPQTLPNSLNQGGFSPNLTIWINQKGLRVAPDCKNAKMKQLAVWPPRIEDWIPVSQRLRSRLPAIDPHCPPIGEQYISDLTINGIENHQTLTPLPLQKTIIVAVDVIGGVGDKQAFLNGQYIKGSGKHRQHFRLQLTHSGHYRFMVLDNIGQHRTVEFTVNSL